MKDYYINPNTNFGVGILRERVIFYIKDDDRAMFK